MVPRSSKCPLSRFVLIKYVSGVADTTRVDRLVCIPLVIKAYFFLLSCGSSLEAMDAWADWNTKWSYVDGPSSDGKAYKDASSWSKPEWTCYECATTAGRHPVCEAQTVKTLTSPSGEASSNKPCTCSLVVERVGKIETEISKVTQLLQDQGQYLRKLVDLLRDDFPRSYGFPILRTERPQFLPSSSTSSPAAQVYVMDTMTNRPLLPVPSRCPHVHGRMRIAKADNNPDIVMTNAIKIETTQQLTDWYNHLGSTLLQHEGDLLNGLWRLVADENFPDYEIFWSKARAHKGFRITHKPCRCVTYARWSQSEEAAVLTMHDESKQESQLHNQAIQAVRVIEGFVGIKATGKQS